MTLDGKDYDSLPFDWCKFKMDVLAKWHKIKTRQLANEQLFTYNYLVIMLARVMQTLIFFWESSAS